MGAGRGPTTGGAGLTTFPLVMPTPRAFRPEDFTPEVDLLEELPGRWAIIGGMAAIIWAERYLDAQERAAAGLDEPLTSKDLDVRGRRAHALTIRGLWGGEGEMQEFRWKDTGRHSWALASHPQGDPRRRVIEVTEQLPGLQPNEGLALRVTHRGLRLHVLDPVSCLKAKSDVLRREMAANVADDRNDARHLVLLLAALPRYLAQIRTQASATVSAEAETTRAEAAEAVAKQILSVYHAQRQTPD